MKEKFLTISFRTRLTMITFLVASLSNFSLCFYFLNNLEKPINTLIIHILIISVIAVAFSCFVVNLMSDFSIVKPLRLSTELALAIADAT